MRGLFRPSLIAAIVFACAVHPPMATAAPPDRDPVAVTALALPAAIVSDTAALAPLALYLPSAALDSVAFAAIVPVITVPTSKPVRARATVLRGRQSSRPMTRFSVLRDRPPANEPPLRYDRT